MYGRRDVAPPPPLPLCRGLATAVGPEAEIKKSTKNVGDPRAKEGKNRGGEGPVSGRRKLFRSRATAPIAAEGRVPWLLTWRSGRSLRTRQLIFLHLGDRNGARALVPRFGCGLRSCPYS